MKTCLAADAPEPSRDPYVTYRAAYRTVMDRTLDAMKRSLLLTRRNA